MPSAIILFKKISDKVGEEQLVATIERLTNGSFKCSLYLWTNIADA
jgi:hypothetical protein